MRLFVLPQSFNGSDTVEISGRDYNYLIKVLRLKEGSPITGRDSEGNIWNLSVLTIKNNSCILQAQPADKALPTTDSLPENRPSNPIILYQCLPKGRKLDDIIRKATEIGAYAVVPVCSKNCVADFSNKEESKTQRYNTIVKEALQQSGSLIPTKVYSPIKIEDVPSDFQQRCTSLNTKGLGLFLHQCTVSDEQSDFVKSLQNHKGALALLIGSEGGFTDTECQSLLKAGFKAILLKTNILRCETAAVYAMAAAQTILESDF